MISHIFYIKSVIISNAHYISGKICHCRVFSAFFLSSCVYIIMIIIRKTLDLSYVIFY